jgi:myo-inositol-1(or 4)-monophosphatase
MSELSRNQKTELAELAEQLAYEAGDIAMSYFGSDARQTRIKDKVELVTEADLAVEEFLRDKLSSETDFDFLGEETGGRPAEDRATWVVDPIDGTTNFARDVPHFAVSIGLWDGNRSALGVIYNPAREECFTCDGRDVYFDDRPLPRLKQVAMRDGLLATGFPYDRQVQDSNNTAALRAVINECLGVRRFGAAALDLAWVAAGRYDGFWEPRLKPWDVTAGIAMVETLGGRVTTYLDEPYDCTAASIVAAPQGLHAELLAVIRQVEGC